MVGAEREDVGPVLVHDRPARIDRDVVADETCGVARVASRLPTPLDSHRVLLALERAQQHVPGAAVARDSERLALERDHP